MWKLGFIGSDSRVHSAVAREAMQGTSDYSCTNTLMIKSGWNKQVSGKSNINDG